MGLSHPSTTAQDIRLPCVKGLHQNHIMPCICTSSAAEGCIISTYAEQVQVMAIQCLSQQVQVYVLIALDLRQSQHCKGCVIALCKPSASSQVGGILCKAVTHGSAARSAVADNLSESLWRVHIAQQAEVSAPLPTCADTSSAHDEHTGTSAAELTADIT